MLRSDSERWCMQKQTNKTEIVILMARYILQIVYYEENITQKNEQKTAKRTEDSSQTKNK